MAEPAERPNQALIGYQHLKQDIINGTFPPGDKLLMSQLKARYDIGAGPMREALSQLVSEKLVTAISQKGFRVANMSLAELEDIYLARAHIEALIVRLAVQHGDDSWEAEVIGKAHALARVMQVKGADDMLNLWDMRHKLFHEAIAKGCGSAKLLEVRAQLFDQAERYRQLWLRQTVFSEQALTAKRQEHQALVDMLLNRDAEAAAELMYQHLLTPVPIITRLLHAQLSSSPAVDQ